MTTQYTRGGAANCPNHAPATGRKGAEMGARPRSTRAWGLTKFGEGAAAASAEQGGGHHGGWPPRPWRHYLLERISSASTTVLCPVPSTRMSPGVAS